MYVKIFQKIFDSSIADDWQQRVVFQDMLILCDRDGVINMTHEAISRRTNVPLEIVRAEIVKLELPDSRSNTPDDDGRRLERIDAHRDWGWKILNYSKYRDIKNSQEMREATRERVARHREKKKAGVENFKKPTMAQLVEAGLSSQQAEQFINHYESNGWKVGRNPMKSWKGAAAGWKSRIFSSNGEPDIRKEGKIDYVAESQG